MASRDTFSRYVYELHEHVNAMLGKTSNLSYDEVRDRYEHFRSRCVQGTELPKYKRTAKSMLVVPNTNKTRKNSKKSKEKGCTTPLYGQKSKCVMSIVPLSMKRDTFTIDKNCELRRGE